MRLKKEPLDTDYKMNVINNLLTIKTGIPMF